MEAHPQRGRFGSVEMSAPIPWRGAAKDVGEAERIGEKSALRRRPDPKSGPAQGTATMEEVTVSEVVAEKLGFSKTRYHEPAPRLVDTVPETTEGPEVQ